MQARVSRSLGKLSRPSITASGSSRTALIGPPTNSFGQNSLWQSVVAALGCWFAISNFAAAADPNNILLDFSATWCGPCQQMSPIVSKLERQGYPIRKVDIDIEKALTQQFNVDSIPCFVLVVNGKEANRITGATDERELRRLLNMLPKQNIDESVFGKSSRNNGSLIPVTNAGGQSSEDKKRSPKNAPLFAKNPDLKLVSTDSDVVRGQSPGAELTADGFARDPIYVSTRIRVKDGSRIHFGSGSIIDSQPGRTVILTCGHIFRDLGKDVIVEVDVFTEPNSKPQTIIGQILKFDLKSDLGLLAIPTPQQLPAIKLAASRGAVSVKDRVVSIGCGGGERPTREDHAVTAINKYLGPDNVECNGIPQQGRSGGGLFLGSELVGVCIAADPKEKRGIYTGMKPVAELLAGVNLGHLAPSLQATEEIAAEDNAPASNLGLGSALAMNDNSSRRNNDDVAGLIEAATRNSGSSVSSSTDYVGAEIVCIIRPKTPGALSRVVIVNQASSRFVDDLLHESSGGRPDPSSTAQVAPVKRSSSDAEKAAPRVAMRKPVVDEMNPENADGPTETSFEPQRYRRKRD